MDSAPTCPACGVDAQPGARFCAECGARLAAARADVPVEGGVRPSVERRQLTVMFCDLVGSTRMSLQLDAEDFTEAVSGYRDACARVVRHWRGFISRYVGDGVLIYFGYPRAEENDALRAVAAAWELSRTIARLELPHPGAGAGRTLHLQSRIGLHTGLVVVGDVIGRDSHESDGALGAAPNIAARLQALCQPGEVVISEATAALLPASIKLVLLDRRSEKADFGDVRAYRVSEVPVDPVPSRALSASGLVGRQDALERLRKAVREGGTRPVAVFVGGEAGVGKSRLAHELTAAGDGEDIRWIHVACSAYGRLSPLHPFREWLRDSEAAEGGGDIAAADAEATPYDRRRRLFGALRTTLLADAPRTGLLIEDLHWADSMTEEFVAELLQTAPEAMVALVITSREAPPAVLAATGRLHLETLPRLTPGDAASLARGIETLRPLTAYELAEIVDHADGVPLYIEEFVRAITARDVGADGIPTTLRDALMGALDTLGAGRTVALCASVFGRRFEYRQLQALLGLDDDVLAPALEALLRARVLVRIGGTPAASFEFRHALLRDTAYHTLLKSERARWHSRVAQLAASGALTIEESMPELLATHHSLGGHRREAIAYWLRARDRAMKRSAHVEALAHVRSGLEDCRQLARDDPGEGERQELELLRRLTAPLIAIAGWSTPELETVYQRAMHLCRAIGSTDAMFEVELGLYNMHLLRSELRTADAIARRLLATARNEPEGGRRGSLLLVALGCRALPAFYGGEPATARRHLLELLSVHDPARDAGHAQRYGTDPVMLAHSYLGWLDAVDGDAAGALARAEAALEHARAERHVFSIGYASCFAASTAQLCGDVERAAHHASAALALGNRHNFQYWIAWAQAIEGWVAGLQSPERGIAIIDAARERYLATGSTLVAPYFAALACRTARAARLPDAQARESRLRQEGATSEVRFWRAVLVEGAAAFPK